MLNPCGRMLPSVDTEDRWPSSSWLMLTGKNRLKARSWACDAMGKCRVAYSHSSRRTHWRVTNRSTRCDSWAAVMSRHSAAW
jgi:hypothetical protein